MTVLVIECKNANKDEAIALGVDQIPCAGGNRARLPWRIVISRRSCYSSASPCTVSSR